MEPANSLVPASDGLRARSVGRWSLEKLFYIGRYLQIVSTGMQKKFASRVYIDLFAGPGKCVLRDGDGREVDGSPLLAVKTPRPFTQYHLVEMDREAEAALRARVDREAPDRQVFYYLQDANLAVETIIDRIPPHSLCLAVADPTGLDLHFSSLKRLAHGRRLDLIYLFPEGMSVKRNLTKFLKRRPSPLDEVLGTDRWRQRATVPDSRDALPIWEAAGRPIVEVFRDQLRSIGYRYVQDGGSEVEIRNTQNVPLYYLLFASKHPRGDEFWGKASAEHPDGQRHLPF